MFQAPLRGKLLSGRVTLVAYHSVREKARKLLLSFIILCADAGGFGDLITALCLLEMCSMFILPSREDSFGNHMEPLDSQHM